MTLNDSVSCTILKQEANSIEEKGRGIAAHIQDTKQEGRTTGDQVTLVLATASTVALGGATRQNSLGHFPLQWSLVQLAILS